MEVLRLIIPPNLLLARKGSESAAEVRRGVGSAARSEPRTYTVYCCVLSSHNLVLFTLSMVTVTRSSTCILQVPYGKPSWRMRCAASRAGAKSPPAVNKPTAVTLRGTSPPRCCSRTEPRASLQTPTAPSSWSTSSCRPPGGARESKTQS